MADAVPTFSKTQILIDSRDRKAGTPSEYYIELQPKIRNVVELKVNSFTGGAYPYTFKVDTLYTIRSGYRNAVGLPFVYTTYDIKIPRGVYNLTELISLLNSYFYNARVRFSYDQVDRRVTISKVQYYYADILYEVTAASQPGVNTYVDTLLGFPQGWALDPDFRSFGIRSSYAVQPQFLPNTLMVGFSNFPSKTVSSSSVIGIIAIPYTARTFDFQSNRIAWAENSEFPCKVECYAEYINRLGVRIVDSRTGEKYEFMEEHIMQLEVTSSDSMGSKPFPNANTV